MQNLGKNIFLFVLLMLLALLVIGCASTAPLPGTLNIIPPAEDVPLEIAAFSGVWEGIWDSALDTVLVVEKIDIENAEVIYSIGKWVNCLVCESYWYHTAKVRPGPAIEWVNSKGNRFIFKMNKDLKSISAVIEEESTGSKYGKAHLTRRKSR